MYKSVKQILKVAISQVGYIEKKSNKNLDSKTANAGANNFTKYNRDMKKIRGAGTINDYWCANFVSWCFYKAYGKKKGNNLMLGFSNYVPYIYNHFQAKKRIYKSAKPGDIVIFKNNSHVGLVYAVKGNYIYTIEGNTSSGDFNANGGAVCKKKYSKSNTWLKCFCRPKYPIAVAEYPTLKLGSKNAYVTKLKKILKYLGYKNMDNNNIYGKGTFKNVKKFQKKYNLKVDGEVGTKTWQQLAKVYKAKKKTIKKIEVKRTKRNNNNFNDNINFNKLKKIENIDKIIK